MARCSRRQLGPRGASRGAPFTEHWDGKSWSIVATPGGVSFFADMAASTGGTVLAVGRGTDNSAIILSN